MNKTLSLILLSSILFCSNSWAEDKAKEKIEYEYEEVTPIIKNTQPNFPANNSQLGPNTISQYEGDHSYWWYAKHQKKYRYYFGMSGAYNLGDSISDLTVDSIEFPSDLLASDDTVLVSAGTDSLTNVKTDVELGNGIGFSLKGGIEYRETVRFDIEIGTKRIFIESMEAFDDYYFDFDGADISLIYNYVGANLAFEWARGIKRISPFVGVGIGGGYFSTSGLGDDFVPYTQGSVGFSYRFNEKIVLELYASSLMITQDFNFTVDYDIYTYTSGSTTYTDLSNTDVDLNLTYSNADSGDLIINSINIAYRFLF